MLRRIVLELRPSERPDRCEVAKLNPKAIYFQRLASRMRLCDAARRARLTE
jgi:hypothetical protein